MLEPMGDFLNGLKILSSYCRQQDACYASLFCPLYDALDITQKFWGIEVAMGVGPHALIVPPGICGAELTIVESGRL